MAYNGTAVEGESVTRCFPDGKQCHVIGPESF
jgi:hypothetical protein